MPLPSLANWDTTAQGLHKAAQVLAAIRLLVLEHSPHYLEFSVKIVPEGLSTDTMPTGGEVILDFRQAAVIVRTAAGLSSTIPLASHNQETLFEEVLGAVNLGELVAPKGARIDALIEAIKTKGRLVIPKRADYSDQTPLTVDPRLGGDYAQALYRIFIGVARFRARLEGFMTPIVVWSEHFDLSFLWFATETAQESTPHVNFGFAPFSPGFERPYLYAYAYPLPPQYSVPILPTPARWNTRPWTGVVLSYDDIAKTADPEAFVEASCLDIYRALLGLLR